MVGADQAEQVPGPIGEDRPVDLGVVLDGREQVVERLGRPAPGQDGEGGLGPVHVLGADGVAEGLGRRACPSGRHLSGLDRVQDLLLGPAVFAGSGWCCGRGP